MLRTGSILLTLWTGFNLLLAFGIVMAMIFFGKNAPGLKIRVLCGRSANRKQSMHILRCDLGNEERRMKPWCQLAA